MDINKVGKLFIEHGSWEDIVRFRSAVTSKDFKKDKVIAEKTLKQLNEYIGNKMSGETNKSLIYDLPKKEKIKREVGRKFSGDSQHRVDNGEFQAKLK